MELGYAFFILLLYVVLVLLGIWLYEYWERGKEGKKPVQSPALSDREKRRKLNELLTPLGFAYDGRQNIFYSRIDSWQRKYEYGRIYDEAAAPFNMIIDCESVYFASFGKKAVSCTTARAIIGGSPGLRWVNFPGPGSWKWTSRMTRSWHYKAGRRDYTEKWNGWVSPDFFPEKNK